MYVQRGEGGVRRRLPGFLPLLVAFPTPRRRPAVVVFVSPAQDRRAIRPTASVLIIHLERDGDSRHLAVLPTWVYNMICSKCQEV